MLPSYSNGDTGGRGDHLFLVAEHHTAPPRNATSRDATPRDATPRDATSKDTTSKDATPSFPVTSIFSVKGKVVFFFYFIKLQTFYTTQVL